MVTDFDTSPLIQIVVSDLNQCSSTLLRWGALISKLTKSGDDFIHDTSLSFHVHYR